MLCISIYLMCNVILNCDFLFLDDQINIFYKKKLTLKDKFWSVRSLMGGDIFSSTNLNGNFP